MNDTPAGAKVPCTKCNASITLPRAVPAEEHAVSDWICDDCMEVLQPGHRAAVAAEAAFIRSLGGTS